MVAARPSDSQSGVGLLTCGPELSIYILRTLSHRYMRAQAGWGSVLGVRGKRGRRDK